MGQFLNEDAISAVLKADDEVARAHFRSAYTAHMDRLRAELAETRKSLVEAERLTCKYAGLIGEQKEALRIAATPGGIAKAIRHLDPGQCYPDTLLPAVTALAGIAKQCTGYEAVVQGLDDAALALMDEMAPDTMTGVDVSEQVQTAMDRQFGGARAEVMNLSLQRRPE
jgi:hypothetical protein